MLTSLLLLCYTLITAYVSGMVSVHVFSRMLGLPASHNDFAFRVISGFCSIAVVLSIQHIFYKVGVASHLLIWAINGTAWLANAKNFSSEINAALSRLKNKSYIIWLIYILFLCGALVNIMSRAAVGDIGDYHLQAIRWIEEYRVVPGIGNIRRQLGNNSNWFLLNAFFGCSFTGLRSVYVLNASLLITGAVYFTGAIETRMKGGKDHLFLIKTTILLYLALTVFRSYVGAVTNDYAVTVITLYIFTLLLDTAPQAIFERIMLIFFMMTMITFKLSAAPMALLGALITYRLFKQINTRQVAMLITLCALVFIPWCYTNVMHSGYLVFPLSKPDLFDADWKMRASVLEWEVMANLAWARVPFTDVQVSSKYLFAQWFPLWIKSLDLFSIALMVLSVVLSLVIACCFIVRSVRKKITPLIKRDQVFILVTIAAALYIWFTHAPTPRFAFGYLTFLVALFLQVLTGLSSWGDRAAKNAKYVPLLLAVIFLFSCISFLSNHFTISSFAGGLLVPKEYAEVKTVALPLDNGYVNMPEKGCQCWDFALPCSSEPDSMVTWRGTTMEDGFRIK